MQLFPEQELVTLKTFILTSEIKITQLVNNFNLKINSTDNAVNSTNH